MKLLENSKSQITKDKNGENILHLEIIKVVLIQCNVVNNDYQQDSGAQCTFVLNKWFGQLLDITPRNFISVYIRVSKYGLRIKF